MTDGGRGGSTELVRGGCGDGGDVIGGGDTREIGGDCKVSVGAATRGWCAPSEAKGGEEMHGAL